MLQNFFDGQGLWNLYFGENKNLVSNVWSGLVWPGLAKGLRQVILERLGKNLMTGPTFSPSRPLWAELVYKSGCLFIYVYVSPSHIIYFQASHWSIPTA